MLRRISILIILLFCLSNAFSEITPFYEKEKVPTGSEPIYDAFIAKNLKNLKNSGQYGKPVELEIKYAKIGKNPIIFSNEFISPLYDIESSYKSYRKNKFGKDQDLWKERFNQRQEKIKKIYNDLTENSSIKEYLVILGVVTNDLTTKYRKDKWIIVIDPQNPEREWRAWQIDPYNQKNTALILTSVDGTALDFLSMPFSDYDLLSEKYDDQMYKFILEPLYDESERGMPFDYPFQ